MWTPMLDETRRGARSCGLPVAFAAALLRRVLRGTPPLAGHLAALLALAAAACSQPEDGGGPGAGVLPSAPMWMLSSGGAESDIDGDAVPDLKDNCPGDYNASQLDGDGDGIGDACDDLGIPMDEFPDPNPVAFETYGKWTKKKVTWALLSWPPALTKAQATQSVQKALGTWQAACGLSFSQVAEAGAPDIEIAMRPKGEHDCQCPFGATTIAHSFYPNQWNPVCPYGEVHFNESYTFTTELRATSWSPVDYETLLLHELGHALGLAHSANEDAVMWKFYTGSRRVLHDDDIAGIQSLYGGPPACVPSKTCADYPGQCGQKSNGCETKLQCECESGFTCTAGQCVDPCAGVQCGACRKCKAGSCVPAFDGTQCTEGGKIGTCTNGQCVDPCAGVQCPACQACASGKCTAAPGWDGKACSTAAGKAGHCKGGACVDLCAGVSCGQCTRCEAGACEADPDAEGEPCATTPGGKPGTCESGVCADPCAGVSCATCKLCVAGVCQADAAADDAPCVAPGGGGGACAGGECVPTSAPGTPWASLPYWQGANCVVQGTQRKLCIDTSEHLFDEVRFVIYEADPEAMEYVTEGTTSVMEKHWKPELGHHVTCMVWPAWWTSDGGDGVPELLLGAEVGGGEMSLMPQTAEAMLHVGKTSAPVGDFCQPDP